MMPGAMTTRLRLGRAALAALPLLALGLMLVAPLARLAWQGWSGEPEFGPTGDVSLWSVWQDDYLRWRVFWSLAQAGVPAVFNGSSSVLSSDAAEDWLTLLTAFTRPRTREVRAVSLTEPLATTERRIRSRLRSSTAESYGITA